MQRKISFYTILIKELQILHKYYNFYRSNVFKCTMICCINGKCFKYCFRKTKPEKMIKEISILKKIFSYNCYSALAKFDRT